MNNKQIDLLKVLLEGKRINSIYLDNEQMKILFNVADKTLYRWRKKQLVFARKIGGKYYYPIHTLMNMMEQPRKK